MGDVNLDGVVNAVDGSNILHYYADLSVGMAVEDCFICPESQNPEIFADNELRNLCEFLADVDSDGIITASDTSEVLINYAEKLADGYTLSNDITNGYNKEEIQASSIMPNLHLRLESSNLISDRWNYGYRDNVYLLESYYDYYINATLNIDISGLESNYLASMGFVIELDNNVEFSRDDLGHIKYNKGDAIGNANVNN